MGDPQSWGDAVRQYKLSKVTTPWATEPEPVRYVTHRQKGVEQRQFDPLLGVYRDERKEAEARDAERRAKIAASNRARDKQLRHVQTYNVVTHKPIVEEPAAKPRRVGPASTRAKYNIVSNLDYSDHHHAPPEERPSMKADPERRMKNYVSHTFEKREYDILSNRYLSQHEKRDSVDRELARRAAADRFWQTRDFNPVTGSYYDRTKEEDFTTTRAEAEKKHVEHAKTHIAPAVARSEGAAYDILANSTKDEERLQRLRESEAKKGFTRVRHSVEAHASARLEAKAELEDARAMHRISERRFEEPRAHGHDIITGKRFEGIGSQPVFAARTTKQKPVWSKVEEAEATMRRTAGARTGTLRAGSAHSRRSGGSGAGGGAGAGRRTTPDAGRSRAPPPLATGEGAVRTGGFR